MLTKRELILYGGTIAIAVCLIVVGVLVYPDSHRLEGGVSADVQSARFINRNH